MTQKNVEMQRMIETIILISITSLLVIIESLLLWTMWEVKKGIEIMIQEFQQLSRQMFHFEVKPKEEKKKPWWERLKIALS